MPPQPINPVPIPVPDWEREKELPVREPPMRPLTDAVDSNKSQYREQQPTSDFRKLTQIEGRNFPRKETRSSDRERDTRDRNDRDPHPRDRNDRDSRDQAGPNFSKHFQSDLPPRFQR